jgi:hypothetical protein
VRRRASPDERECIYGVRGGVIQGVRFWTPCALMVRSALILDRPRHRQPRAEEVQDAGVWVYSLSLKRPREQDRVAWNFVGAPLRWRASLSLGQHPATHPQALLFDVKDASAPIDIVL